MIKLYTNGGLGDAVMSLAKIHAKYSSKEIKDIKLTHIRGRQDKLNEVIREFYDSQGIQNQIVSIPKVYFNNEADKSDIKDLGTFLGMGWSEKNSDGDPDSWEINPFPKINTKSVTFSEEPPTHKPYILLHPSSGSHKNMKWFDEDELGNFLKKYPDTIITGSSEFSSFISLVGFRNNYYNKTSITELINIISSVDIIIATEGFVPYIGAMLKKKVYCLSENMPAIIERKHPAWDFHLINGLEDVDRGRDLKNNKK